MAFALVIEPGHATIVEMRIVSLGDLALDVVVETDADRARDADTAARIGVDAGGQGANVAAWAATLGADARWLGARGDDAPGRLVAERLAARGVELCGPIVSGPGCVVVSLSEAGGARSMFPDRGVATRLHPDDVRDDWLLCDHLHVSGYALLAEPVADAALRAGALAREAGARVSVDLSSWSTISEVGAGRFAARVETLAPDVVFANEDEAALIGEIATGAAWIVKRGARGASFAGDERAALPVPRVVDTTGAGDALAAGYLVGGADLALEAAARCVGRLGAMP